MISFKHLCKIISNFERSRSFNFALKKRLVAVLSTTDNNFQIFKNERYYSSRGKNQTPYPSERQKISPSEYCHTPNLMSASPQPKETFSGEYEKQKKKNMRIFYLGMITFIVAIVTTYVTFKMEKKSEVKSDLNQLKHIKRKGKKIIDRNPESDEEIPKKVPYLLIGGGTASFSAFRAIKSADPEAHVLMISDETYLPYMRPPLSKEMWFNVDQEKVQKLMFKQWNGTERSLLYEPVEFYTSASDLLNQEHGGVAAVTGYKVVELDPYCHKVKLDTGYEIEYEKALLAPGAQPKILPVLESAKTNPKVAHRVKELRNVSDFENLRKIFKDSSRVAVIGGGFLGSELACAMARVGSYDKKTVFQIFKEGGNLGKVLPEYLSRWTTQKVIKEGVIVKPNLEIVSCKYNDKEDILELLLNNQETLKVDLVVVCTGVVPNTLLSKKGGLEIDAKKGGFLVNSELQARTDLYVAGDAVSFYDPKFGRRHIEHHDHAVVTGRLAGENMTGARKPYLHQSMFWSDLGPEIGFEAIGLVDSQLPTVGVFAKSKPSDTPKAHVTEMDSDAVRTRVEIDQNPASCDKLDSSEKKEIELSSKTLRKDMPGLENPDDFGKGVIFYLRNEKVVGMVLWNVFNRIQVARQILKEDKTYEDLNEVAKLFNIHKD